VSGWLAVEDWNERVYAVPDPPVVVTTQTLSAVGNVQQSETTHSLLAVDDRGKTMLLGMGVTYIGTAVGPRPSPAAAIDQGHYAQRRKAEQTQAAKQSIEQRIAG
jgi:hypothetical protein